MKRERSPQEKFEYSRKGMRGSCIALICTFALNFVFTMIKEFTDIFERLPALELAISFVFIFLLLLFGILTVVFGYRLKRTAATMADDREEQNEGH